MTIGDGLCLPLIPEEKMAFSISSFGILFQRFHMFPSVATKHWPVSQIIEKPAKLKRKFLRYKSKL